MNRKLGETMPAALAWLQRSDHSGVLLATSAAPLLDADGRIVDTRGISIDWSEYDEGAEPSAPSYLCCTSRSGTARSVVSRPSWVANGRFAIIQRQSLRKEKSRFARSGFCFSVALGDPYVFSV